MPESTRLRFPYLAAAQAQKHLTVNESLLRLDALVQLSARSARVAAQPAAPADGDIYLLPAGKSGADWAGMAEGALAYFRDGVWEELTPRPGWRCHVEDEGALYARGALGWDKLAARGERRLILTPGGDGVVSIYRVDAPRAQNPRTAAIASVAADVITLVTATADLFFTANMAGVSFLRIWNIDKSPAQPAWVKASPAADALQVVDAAAVAGWSAGEIVQIGDPTEITPGRVIALDISPLMQNALGRVFPQAGAQLKGLVEGVGTQAVLDTSEAGLSGSFSGVRSEESGSRLFGQYVQPCSVASPVSNSNMVFLRESATGFGLAITGLWIVGLWV